MASNSSESKPSQPGSQQSLLARIRDMVQSLKTTDQQAEELLPTWDAMGSDTNSTGNASPPVAELVPPGQALPADLAQAVPIAEPVPIATWTTEPHGGEAATAVPQRCPHCQAPVTGQERYCADCGWIFQPAAAPATLPAAESTRPRLHDRYELGARICERGEVVRFHGLDHAGDGAPVRVIILRSALSSTDEAMANTPQDSASRPVDPGGGGDPRASSPPIAEVGPSSGDVLPATDESTTLPQAEVVALPPVWPSIAWERALLDKLQLAALPRVLDAFVEDGFEYLVEELPVGQSLWDAWEESSASAEQRFAWLKQIAGLLYHLYQANALLEALRPDILVLAPDGQPRFTDLSDLLPLPLPANPPIRATAYTAPELVLASDQVDSRAAIYSFGAMLYALHLGRELTELDFELQGVPKPFLQRFPDAHPLFGRLISKTFCRNPQDRFPTEEAAREDATGFAELVRCLEDCRQTLDIVRLEIAAWTTTGMVRSGNEDAFALLHVAEARENRLGDAALVLVADGMGGYEAGEVAASLAVQALRDHLIKQKPFAAFTGEGVLPSSLPPQEPQGDAPRLMVEVEAGKAALAAALQYANQQVYSAASADPSRQGMGCTVEAVYVDGRHLLVGHVGDSRTYHLHEGRLVQLTQDQTWVQRMVELGAMTAQEAAEHPRRSELQQAIGGRPEVEPALYHSPLRAGDWVVVCSDGLSNHMTPEALQELLQSARSAEGAARRLVNSVNLAGATDNATVVVIRAT